MSERERDEDTARVCARCRRWVDPGERCETCFEEEHEADARRWGRRDRERAVAAAVDLTKEQTPERPCAHVWTDIERDEDDNRIRTIEGCSVCGNNRVGCFAKRERPEFRSVWSSVDGETAYPREDDGMLWWGPVGEWTYDEKGQT